MNQSQFKLDKLVKYIQKLVKNGATQFLYISFLLYYAFRNPNTPSWARNIILGAFAYLLSPLDAVPDLTPFIGMTDDLGVLSFGLTTIACYIDDEVRQKARKQLEKINNSDNKEKLIQEIDSWL